MYIILKMLVINSRGKKEATQEQKVDKRVLSPETVKPTYVTQELVVQRREIVTTGGVDLTSAYANPKWLNSYTR